MTNPDARLAQALDSLEKRVRLFRSEVQDKLGVVYHGCGMMPLSRTTHLRQCEDFLVELFQSEVAALLADVQIAEQAEKDFWHKTATQAMRDVERLQARETALRALVEQWRDSRAIGDNRTTRLIHEMADELAALLAAPPAETPDKP